MGAYGIITRRGVPASAGAEQFLAAVRAVLAALQAGTRPTPQPEGRR